LINIPPANIVLHRAEKDGGERKGEDGKEGDGKKK
jgi:hypothetical protein